MGIDVFHATGPSMGKIVFSNGQMEFEMCTFVAIPYEACKAYQKKDGLMSSQEKVRD